MEYFHQRVQPALDERAVGTFRSPSRILGQQFHEAIPVAAKQWFAAPQIHVRPKSACSLEHSRNDMDVQISCLSAGGRL